MIEIEQVKEQQRLDNMQQSLNNIEQKLDAEIASKQKLFDRQEQDIQQLYKTLDEKNLIIEENKAKLERCAKETEGGRQLINKLLNDIERLQQDIEWYKRTYEHRSFLGMLKERMKLKSQKK